MTECQGPNGAHAPTEVLVSNDASKLGGLAFEALPAEEGEGGTEPKYLGYKEEDDYFWGMLTGAPPLVRLRMRRSAALAFLGWEAPKSEEGIMQALDERRADLVRYAVSIRQAGREEQDFVWLLTLEEARGH